MKKKSLLVILFPILLVVVLGLLLPKGPSQLPIHTPTPAPLPLVSAAPAGTAAPDETPSYGEEGNGPSYTDGVSGDENQTTAGENWLDEDGTYSSMEDVALYLRQYGQLPDNFITKNEARDLGWTGGGLERYAEGKCIGGDWFGNYEGLLPKGTYHECDINTLGADTRGGERLVWDDNGNIYYTADHYESFELVYSAEN